jgi:hypothetical protein
MSVIAVFALLFALIRFELVALVTSVVGLFFYLLYRRVRLTPAMFLIAAFGVLLLASRFGHAAAGVIGLIVAYHVILHRYVLSGPPLPRRSPVRPPLPRRTA